MNKILTLVSEAEKDFELLDSGEGEKLERYGDIIVSRPDPQAVWLKAKKEIWRHSSAIFENKEKGGWIKKKHIPSSWKISFGGFLFNIHLSAFKHTGIFPEHKSSWEWITDVISKEKRQVSVLNLFAYTGGASLAALKAGAKVTHLDASKTAVNWARKNVVDSKLEDKNTRWIIDDALSFIKREERRGNKYDAFIMDPPAYGRGPKGEIWQIERNLLDLLTRARNIMSDNPSFILLNGYAAGYSAISYANVIETVFPFMSDELLFGEISIRESERGIILPSGIFARWQNNK